MKKIIILSLLSFNVLAQVPFTNYTANKDTAVVCNNTNTEAEDHDGGNAWYGKTTIKVLFKAWGCFNATNGQLEVCNAQELPAGKCASYHFRGGTSGKIAQICLPEGHGNCAVDWNCGSEEGHGHLQFDMHNGVTAGAKNLSCYLYGDHQNIGGHISINGHEIRNK